MYRGRQARRLALHGLPRRSIARLHRWSGLVTMACLVVASLTGVWLVFRSELDRMLSPHLRVVRPGATRVPSDDVVSRVERAFPDARVTLLGAQARPDDAILVSVRPRGSEPLDFDQVFVNPYNGEILGTRTTSLVSVTRASLDSLMLGLHYSLLLDTPGIWIMGTAAVVWLLTSILGVALAWPGGWWRPASWKAVLSARTSDGAYKANYNLHRAAGLCFLPVTIVLAFTSFGLNFPQYVRPFVHRLSPLTRQPTGHTVPDERTRVSFGDAETIVANAVPASRTSSTYRDLTNGRYSVHFRLPGDVNPHGDNFAFVDVETGALTGVRRPSRLAAGDRFMSWLFPLHTGAAFGMPGRIVVALSGVAMVVLNATGLYVWWTKWRMRRRQHAHRGAVGPAQNVSRRPSLSERGSAG